MYQSIRTLHYRGKTVTNAGRANARLFQRSLIFESIT